MITPDITFQMRRFVAAVEQIRIARGTSRQAIWNQPGFTSILRGRLPLGPPPLLSYAAVARWAGLALEDFLSSEESPEDLPETVDPVQHRADKKQKNPLTERYKQILRAVAQGKTNKEIAAKLGTSDQTVKNQLTTIFCLLAVPDRAAAVTVALWHGWISLEEIYQDLEEDHEHLPVSDLETVGAKQQSTASASEPQPA